jgi:hypothetical protein
MVFPYHCVDPGTESGKMERRDAHAVEGYWQGVMYRGL